MKSKIILMLIISSITIGCIVPQELTISENVTKNIIPDTIADINDYINNCKKTMTSIQCEKGIDNRINGNYIIWVGTVTDATKDVLFVSVDYNDAKWGSSQAKVRLYDIDTNELLKFKRGDNVKFTGKINIEKIKDMNLKGEQIDTGFLGYSTAWYYMITGNIDLHNVEIIT